MALLAAHGILLVWVSWSHSPTVNEPSHLASGLSHLRSGRFDLYRVNPPLVRTWAGVWAACLCPKADWSRYSTSPQDRREAAVALSFLKGNGFQSFRLATAARLGCIPLSLLGGYICLRWASEVYGPKNGHAHLLDSNIDWGQDLLYLKGWLDEHREAEPLRLAYYGLYDARIVGIEYLPPPIEPEPGWHALSVNKIRGHTRQYEYFLHFRPTAMAGYSICAYHVTLEAINYLRRGLRLPQLPACQQPDGGAGDEHTY